MLELIRLKLSYWISSEPAKHVKHKNPSSLAVEKWTQKISHDRLLLINVPGNVYVCTMYNMLIHFHYTMIFSRLAKPHPSFGEKGLYVLTRNIFMGNWKSLKPVCQSEMTTCVIYA